MPWVCPACSTQITHLPGELAPRIGKIYRCPVCKLELTLDTDGTHLVLAPLERNDVDGTKPRNQKAPRPRQPHRRGS